MNVSTLTVSDTEIEIETETKSYQMGVEPNKC